LLVLGLTRSKLEPSRTKKGVGADMGKLTRKDQVKVLRFKDVKLVFARPPGKHEANVLINIRRHCQI
jgi:hypothetical protein